MANESPTPSLAEISDWVRRMQRSAEEGELYGFADDCRRMLVRLAAAPSEKPRLHVKVVKTNESNERAVWIVFLAHDEDAQPWDCLQLYADSIKGRAEYEAAVLRHFLGQGPEPDILAFDTDAPKAQASHDIEEGA